jgi:photosystem I subunit 11
MQQRHLPAYRRGISAQRRGLEVGLAHGYWFVGPFAYGNPLRNTDTGNLVGLLSAIGLVVISTLAISLYAASNPPKPIATITTPNPPAAFNDQEGWNKYASGFLIGGLGGAVVAYFLIENLDLFKSLIHI